MNAQANRRLNIKPNLWGPIMWALLHSIAESMPNELTTTEQKAMRNFFSSLPMVLPCQKCRNHLLESYNEGYFPDVQSRDSIRDGLFRLHNKVSRDLGKPEADVIPGLDTLLLQHIKPKSIQSASLDLSTPWWVYAAFIIIILILVYAATKRTLL